VTALASLRITQKEAKSEKNGKARRRVDGGRLTGTALMNAGESLPKPEKRRKKTRQIISK
jgi:hypothetical protein